MLHILNGNFIPATELEILEEKIKVLEHIDLENVPFYRIHPTNSSSISGTLPQDKEKMIAQLKNYIKNADDDFLNSSKERKSL